MHPTSRAGRGNSTKRRYDMWIAYRVSAEVSLDQGIPQAGQIANMTRSCMYCVPAVVLLQSTFHGGAFSSGYYMQVVRRTYECYPCFGQLWDEDWVETQSVV